MSQSKIQTPTGKAKLKIGDFDNSVTVGKPVKIVENVSSADEKKKKFYKNDFVQRKASLKQTEAVDYVTDSYGKKLTPYTCIDPHDDIDEKYLIRISNTPVDCSDIMKKWYDWDDDYNPEPIGVLTILDDVGQFIFFQVHLQNGFLNVLANNERLRLFDIKMRLTQTIDEFIYLHRYTAPRICLILFDEFLSPSACERFPFPVNMSMRDCEFEEPPSIFEDDPPELDVEPSILDADGRYHEIIEIFGLRSAFQ